MRKDHDDEGGGSCGVAEDNEEEDGGECCQLMIGEDGWCTDTQCVRQSRERDNAISARTVKDEDEDVHEGSSGNVRRGHISFLAVRAGRGVVRHQNFTTSVPSPVATEHTSPVVRQERSMTTHILSLDRAP